MEKCNNLIYDVGMNNGDDTAYYLHKGYNVIAIEADPCLSEQAGDRFRSQVERGQLTILNIGISHQSGYADFWVNDVYSEWSSFDRNIASRDGLPHHAIHIPCVTFETILQEYGVPHYLKIDIEGNDILCVNALACTDLPEYVSVEMGGPELILKLRDLGYSQFKCIDQSNLLPLTVPANMDYQFNQLVNRLVENKSRPATMLKRLIGWQNLESLANRSRRAADWFFPMGSSGSFGADTPGAWQTCEQIMRCWQYYLGKHASNRTRKTYSYWCDLHARAPGHAEHTITQPV